MTDPLLQPLLRVQATKPCQDFTFANAASYRIGRQQDCEICLDDDLVSRKHAEIWFESGSWWIRDTGSTNGISVAGERVERIAITNNLQVQLGGGPILTFEVIPPPEAAPDIDRYTERYLTGEGNEPVGERTMYIRQAYSALVAKHKQRHRRYRFLIAAFGLLAAASGGYTWYLHHQTKDQLQLARDLFYGMKAMDVEVARMEVLIEESGNTEANARIREHRKRRLEMSASYNRFLETIRTRDAILSGDEQLIVRVTRIFGEFELDLPQEFLREVQNYILQWRSTGGFASAVQTARANGYVQAITSALLAEHLPPQFFYLAMQESKFDPFASGPQTKFGIAKGMWQFIPRTGVRYGLQIGPMVDLPRPDPADDRHDWKKSTLAAARYIKDLYGTDAQASGLLVMACYNWGEEQVLPLVRSMPTNPKERNFWRLLSNYSNRVPQETYNYVFSIVAAAVIGEDPRRFGFDFDNPLMMETAGTSRPFGARMEVGHSH